MTTAGPEYYDIEGNPISTKTWATLWEDMDYRTIAKTKFECRSGPAEVSTVWLGTNHNFVENGPPIIFESLVFCRCESEDMFRYATKEEAAVGHMVMLRGHQDATDYLLKDGIWIEVVW